MVGIFCKLEEFFVVCWYSSFLTAAKGLEENALSVAVHFRNDGGLVFCYLSLIQDWTL